MNPIRTIRRLACILAGLTAAALAFAAAAPAALATLPPPDPGQPAVVPAPSHTTMGRSSPGSPGPPARHSICRGSTRPLLAACLAGRSP
jgi:hypothetical protein